nr:hypothetical protein [Tanacetum cinerariifolium]
SMTHEEVEELVARRVAEEIEARKVTRNLEALNEIEEEQEGENGGNENGETEEIGTEIIEEMRMGITEEMEMKEIGIMA